MKYLMPLCAIMFSSVAFAAGPSYVSSLPVSSSASAASSTSTTPTMPTTAAEGSAKKTLAPIDPMYARFVQLNDVLYVYDERAPKETMRPNNQVDYEGALRSSAKQVRDMMNDQQRMDRVGSFPEPLLKLPSMPGNFGSKSLPQYPSKMNQQIRGNQPTQNAATFVSPFAK